MIREFFETLRKWWAITSAVILLMIAALGFLYDSFDRFGGHDIVSHWVSTEQVLVFLVALLCGGLGAERLLTLRKIENDIGVAQKQRTVLIEKASQISHDIERIAVRIGKLRAEIVVDLKDAGRLEEDIFTAVKRINKTEVLVGPHEIEVAARMLLDECDDSEKIKATGQYRVGDGLSTGYFQHVAERVSKAQKNQGSMEYHVVVSSAEAGPSHEDDERVKAFSDANLRERLKMRGVKHPWPFEVLIGGHSMIIALLGGDTKSKYEIAVKITDPDFVEKASDWYREVAWEGAERI